jgi:hypothetical protein
MPFDVTHRSLSHAGIIDPQIGGRCCHLRM